MNPDCNDKESVFVVGDVHGCFATLQKLLLNYDESKDLLVFVGDLIDRGPAIVETLDFAREVSTKGAVVLKGNHELEFIKHMTNPPNYGWLKQGGFQTIDQMEISGKFMLEYKTWLENCKTSLTWYNVYVTHAGLSELWVNQTDFDHPNSILWNRGPVKKLAQVQVFGHTPHALSGPMWIEESNAWNVDTGAYKGNGLSAIRLNRKGEKLQHFFEPTLSSEIISNTE